MISVNNLTYNGNPVTNLTYDGNPVNVLNVNNTYLWNSSTEFTAKMILVDSDTTGEPVEGTSARINGNCRYAMWRWQGSHNYPCISSEYWGNDVYNYLIAAACQVSAEAFHLDKLYDN